MTNSQLGSAICVSHSMASRIRNGKRLPGVRTIDRIHNALGIEHADLIAAHMAGPDAFGRLIRKSIAQPAK